MSRSSSEYERIGNVRGPLILCDLVLGVMLPYICRYVNKASLCGYLDSRFIPIEIGRPILKGKTSTKRMAVKLFMIVGSLSNFGVLLQQLKGCVSILKNLKSSAVVLRIVVTI